MPKYAIYLPDQLGAELDAYAQEVRDTTGGRVARSEVIQEALHDYLANRADSVREVKRTYAQRRKLDDIVYELRDLRRSLAAREGRENVADGQHHVA